MPHTGENAPQTGTYRCTSCGETVQTEQGNHLPPCPEERDAREWEFVGEGGGERS